MGKNVHVYVASCITQSGYEGDQAENPARDMSIIDYGSPQLLGVFLNANDALKESIKVVWAEIEELYDGGEDDLSALKVLKETSEWVEVIDMEHKGLMDQVLDYGAPMRQPDTTSGRPNLVAGLINRNPNNKGEWDFEAVVVIQEVSLL